MEVHSGGRDVATTLRRGGLKVARGIKRRLRPNREALRREPDSPRLLFRPSAGEWVVSYNEQWFAPAETSDLDMLLSTLPAEVVDEHVLASPKRGGGFVRVVDDQGQPSLEFLSSFGEVITRAANLLPGMSLVTCEWSHGAHGDGWVETVATLRLDGVRRCSLVAYLPELDGANDGAKQLAVQVPVGRRTTVDIHRLERGQPNMIELYRSSERANGITLTLHTSSPEPADDDRPLGFIATRIEAQR